MTEENYDLADIQNHCKQLLNQSLLMVKTYIDDLKQSKDYSEEKLNNVSKILKNLTKRTDDMTELNIKGEGLILDDPNYIMNVLELGDRYNEWMYEYTAEIMPQLESLKNEFEAKEENEQERE